MLMLLRRRCRAWLEIRRLDKELAQSSGLPLELPQIVPNAWNEVVWRLPVPNHPDAFMTASNLTAKAGLLFVVQRRQFLASRRELHVLVAGCRIVQVALE